MLKKFKIFSSYQNNRLVFDIVLVILVGLLVAQGTISVSGKEAKWMNAYILALIGLTGLVIIPDRQKFLLYFSAFLLPLNLNFHLIYQSVAFARPISGFQIKAFDFPFFLLMLFWVMKVIWNPKIKVRLHLWFTIPYLMIVLLCVISFAQTSIHVAVKAGTLFIVIKNLMIFLYLANNLNDRRTIYIIIGVILLSGIFQSLVGIGQYLKGGPIGLGFLGEKDIYSAGVGLTTVSRVGGTIGHPNKMALFLAFLIQINIALLFLPVTRGIKALCVSPILVMLPTLILTHSRGAWGSLLLAGSINLYWCMAKKTQQKIMSGILVVAIVGVLVLGAIGLVDSVRNRIFGDDKGSSEIRAPMEVIALNIIRHHYWTGVGLNNYASMIHKYDNSPEGASYHFPMPVHNEYFLIAAELGVPALIIFVFLLFFVVKLHVSVSRKDMDSIFPFIAIGFLCGWGGWAFHHKVLYEYVFFSHNIWYYLGIIQAIKNYIENTNNSSITLKQNIS